MTRSGEKCRLERIPSAEILKNAIQELATKCVDGISAKEHRCRFYANATISVAAALNPYIGYVSAAELVAPASGRQFFVLLPQRRTAGGTRALPDPSHGKTFERNPNSDCE
jgi:hypothetical protein